MPSQRTVNVKNYLSKLSPDCCNCLLLQYADSENCMMELRFAVLNVGLPLVLCIVGTKRDWEMSEVRMNEWQPPFDDQEYKCSEHLSA